jgi:uncharacterized protein (DUF983 family)
MRARAGPPIQEGLCVPHTAPAAITPPPVQPLPVRWTPDRSVKLLPWPTPALAETLLRGLRGRCPCCGEGKIFNGFLTLAPECTACHAPLGRIRADDLPPYLTIFVVAHVIVIGMLLVEQAYAPPLWVHTIIWIPLTLALTFALMRPMKGAVVGLMLKLGMLDAQPESFGGNA